MNENLIEEENTVYEIDPDCRVETEKTREKIWKKQQWRGEGNSFPCALLLLILLCHDGV